MLAWPTMCSITGVRCDLGCMSATKRNIKANSLSTKYQTDTDISDGNITSIDGNAMSYHLLTLWVIFPAAMMIYLAVKNMESK